MDDALDRRQGPVQVALLERRLVRPEVGPHVGLGCVGTGGPLDVWSLGPILRRVGTGGDGRRSVHRMRLLGRAAADERHQDGHRGHPQRPEARDQEPRATRSEGAPADARGSTRETRRRSRGPSRRTGALPAGEELDHSQLEPAIPGFGLPSPEPGQDHLVEAAGLEGPFDALLVPGRVRSAGR